MADFDTGDSGSHGKKGHGVRAKKMSTRIDMTPMVDLAFLLVTFFMLTTTMAKPKTMEILMPDNDKDTANTPKLHESEALTIIAAPNNKLYYYSGIEKPELKATDYTEKGIGKVIDEKDAIARNFQQQNGYNNFGVFVLIKPMDKSSYANVVDILDEMKIHNKSSIGIFDISPKEIELVNSIR